ncbi:MAG TPA: hypothetical protein VHL34_21225, partial [Rhizomicrobium sp.]|nr:hypothetical protein [Rhizomicrobium sp.]
RVRRCARVIAGAAMKTIRQVRRANGIGFTAEELTLPLAGEGPSGERLCFTFADFDPEALQFRAEAGNASYDTPAFAQFAELWRS